MGLFSSIGRALKGISKVAGFIPGVGGTISKLTGTVGGLLEHKRPMSSPRLMNTATARGQSIPQPGLWGARLLRSTPVLPGGAVSTPSGIVVPRSSSPPMSFGDRWSRTVAKRQASSDPYRDEVRAQSRYGKRRRKRRVLKVRSKRRAGSRRLKFGSPAWRKKYMKRR